MGRQSSAVPGERAVLRQDQVGLNPDRNRIQSRFSRSRLGATAGQSKGRKRGCFGGVLEALSFSSKFHNPIKNNHLPIYRRPRTNFFARMPKAPPPASAEPRMHMRGFLMHMRGFLLPKRAKPHHAQIYKTKPTFYPLLPTAHCRLPTILWMANAWHPFGTPASPCPSSLPRPAKLQNEPNPGHGCRSQIQSVHCFTQSFIQNKGALEW